MEPKALRGLHFGSIAAAIVLILLGLLAFGGPNDATLRLVIILALAALLGVQVWVYVQDRKEPVPAAAEPWVEPAAPAPAQESRRVIRCKQCGEVFPVVDTGERPLVAACPHCGKSGAIKVRP